MTELWYNLITTGGLLEYASLTPMASDFYGGLPNNHIFPLQQVVSCVCVCVCVCVLESIKEYDIVSLNVILCMLLLLQDSAKFDVCFLLYSVNSNK